MTDRLSADAADAADGLDRWLRRELDFDLDPAAGTRIAAAALDPARPVGAKRVAARRLLLGAALVAAGLLGGRFLFRDALPMPHPAETIRIANFGDLVAVVDPAGATRLQSPPRDLGADAPRLIIQIGDNDVP